MHDKKIVDRIVGETHASVMATHDYYSKVQIEKNEVSSAMHDEKPASRIKWDTYNPFFPDTPPSEAKLSAAPDGYPNKPLSYWSLRLCDALEASVIDAELVQRCIEAIREYS